MVNKKLAVQFALAIAIICFLVYKANPLKVMAALSKINPLWLLTAIALFVFINLFVPFGMKLFFNPISNIKLRKWLKYYIYTISASQVIPGKIGDFILVYFLKKEGIKTGESAALIILDKLIVVLVALVLAAIGIKVLLIESTIYWGIMAAIIILTGGILVISPPGTALIRKIIGKYSSKFPGFSMAIKRMVLQHSPRLVLNLVMIVFRFFLLSVYFYTIFRGMGISAPILIMMPLFAITAITSLVPLTPNGLGLRESVGLVLFGKIGVGTEIALSAYLIDLTLNYLLASLGLYFFIKNKELARLREERQSN